ncbi:MAG: hypothetical protein UZ01_02741 [Candidatus Brocadia sinica]|nr:MAG: hypothetical protein UZ01_02741 [Candidatus Brocadia sinica]
MEVLRKGSDRVKVAVVEWKKKGFDEWWVRMGERFAPEVEGEAFTCRFLKLQQEPPYPMRSTPGLQCLRGQPPLPDTGTLRCGRARR